jgi:hypothetical protein
MPKLEDALERFGESADWRSGIESLKEKRHEVADGLAA